jgi:hypothetical protein
LVEITPLRERITPVRGPILFAQSVPDIRHQLNSDKLISVNMVTWCKCFPVFLLLSVAGYSQQPCGIFVKRGDFVQNQVTYQFDDCSADVQVNKDIIAHHQCTELRFKFEFIYGYSDGKYIYRADGSPSFWRDPGYYKVIYDRGVIVYSRTSHDSESFGHVNYYFSLSKDSPILTLKRRFYSFVPEMNGAFQLHTTQLKKHIGLPVNDDRSFVKILDGRLLSDQKTGPAVSARVRTIVVHK